MLLIIKVAPNAIESWRQTRSIGTLIRRQQILYASAFVLLQASRTNAPVTKRRPPASMAA